MGTGTRHTAIEGTPDRAARGVPGRPAPGGAPPQATIERGVGLAVGLSVPVAMVLGAVLGAPVVPLAVVGAALVLGTVRIRRFWRIVGRALLAGGLAGVLVLGPGYRVAMRVVAIVDPLRSPELSLEGTLFILVGIGLVFGAVTTAWTSLLARTWALSRRAGVGLLTVVTLVSLFADSATVEELRELGAGLWMNVPMFAGTTLVFAVLADRWARPEPAPAADGHGSSHGERRPAMMSDDRAGRSG